MRERANARLPAQEEVSERLEAIVRESLQCFLHSSGKSVRASWHGAEWILENVWLGELTLVPRVFRRPPKMMVKHPGWLPEETYPIPCSPKGKPKGLPIPAKFVGRAKSWWFGSPESMLRPMILIPYEVGRPIPELTTTDPQKYAIGNIRLETIHPLKVGPLQHPPEFPVPNTPRKEAELREHLRTWCERVMRDSAVHILRDPLSVQSQGGSFYVVPPEKYLEGLRRLFMKTPLKVRSGEELDAHGKPVRAQRELHERFDPAVAMFTDGTNLLYSAVPYIEPSPDLKTQGQ